MDGKLLSELEALQRRWREQRAGVGEAAARDIDAGFEALHAHLAASDCGEHRATALEFAPYEERIRRVQKMEAISTLAAGIAHHFNNLLMGILGAARMASRNLEPQEPALPYLAEISAAAERGAELTRKLVAFGRVRPPELRPTRVGEIVESTQVMLRELLGEDVLLKVDLNDHEVRVMADPEQIEQVLMHLALNARSAMPAGGELTISSELVDVPEGSALITSRMRPGEYVALSVRDTGCGMDETTRARIFEPFYTTKPEGTGLGLYIVYGVINGLGGRVDVESAPGHGTTFRILLPALELTSMPEDANGNVVPQAQKPRVMVVEDERLIRITLRHTLQEHGFDVLCAADSTEALSQIDQSQRGIDLLLTDMILPGMSGAELARTLGARQPKLAVVFMSAYPRDLLVAQGRIDASARTLEKPFDEDCLLETVDRALGRTSGNG